MKLRVAACAFPVSGSPRDNGRHVLRQMASARRRGARVVLFPECALGGYAGWNFRSFAGYPWRTLERLTRDVMAAAGRLGLWVVLGSNHRLSGRHRPHNSLYLITPRGEIADRYDKRFCTGARGAMDHRHYTPGTRPVTFVVDSVRCGLLICHDWRYPEVYRDYARRGVKVVFQAWYDGGLSAARHRREGRNLGEVIRSASRAHAAQNHLWICGTNTSRANSCFGPFVTRPDGAVADSGPRNRPAVVVSTIDTDLKLPDPSRAWRDRAARGILHSGDPVSDPRSRDRTGL